MSVRAAFSGNFPAVRRECTVQPRNERDMTDLTQTSDETLLRRSAAGDEEAFSALYRRRQAGVYRFALHMSGSAVLAEEVTQDVFMTVIRDGGKFDESRGSVNAFLIGVARNYVLKALQRNRAYIGLEDEQAETAPAGTGNVLADLTRAQVVENVRQAVLQLPAVYREAIVMCDLEEMTYAEAAVSLGVPVGTVRSRIFRGRALLVQKLSEPGAQGFDSLRCFA
jgi:RNA polymerase sigma-70 factor, ECF subfamily